MSLLARKIKIAKWSQSTELGNGEIAADAVTADLRTAGNRLSFWTCERPLSTELPELRAVVLALATASDRIDRIDLAWFERRAAADAGLSIEDNAGRTPVKTLQTRHAEVAKLDYRRLGKVAELVEASVRTKCIRIFSKIEVREIVREAVEAGLVAVDDLQEPARSEIRNALAGRS